MTDKSANARLVVGYYSKKIKRYPFYVISIILTTPIAIIFNRYIPPLILANVLDRLSRSDFTPHELWNSFGSSLFIYLVVLLVSATFWRVVDYFVWRLEGRVEQDIAEEVFNHLLAKSPTFHANNFSGSLVSSANKLIANYPRFTDPTIFTTYPLLIGLVTTAIILWPKSPIYVFVITLVSVLFLIIAFMISRPVRRRSAIYGAAENKQTGFLADAITNIMAIKSFAGERFERRKFNKTTTHTKNKLLQLARTQQIQMNILSILSRIMQWLALFVAVIGVVNYGSNVATVFLIFTYTASITEQLFSFSESAMRTYNRAIGDATAMAAILQEPPEITDPKLPLPFQPTSGTILLDKVTFTHDGSNHPLFNNFSLKIKPGEKVGLVGHSGSGKTTLTRLLLRFSDIQHGSITIDGHDIAKIRQSDLRQAIAYVPQEPLLFHRTLSENIAYGHSKPKSDEVVAAAKMAHAHDFIKDLPDGYSTLVGERGVKLSGGQRQRVAIARAMLKNAPILLLDEATSALDSESEALIQDALWRLMEGKTTIVIAHRLSTIQKMNRIIVMDNGQIIEEGSHNELLIQNGKYAELWSRQSGGFIEA